MRASGLASVLGLLLFLACGDNANRSTTLVRVDAEAPGANCSAGGVAIHTGSDENRSGTLDDSEITATEYLCNAPTGVRCLSGTIVQGTITIRQLADFAQLDGVNCIDGDLIIAGTDLDALPALADLSIVTGGVVVAGNAHLQTLDGVSFLREIGKSFSVQGNDSLINIAGLGGLVRVQGLTISGNDTLVDLSGLEAFAELKTQLTITNNSSLQSLKGLENLTATTEAITIRSNRNLQTLAALNNLRSAALLEIVSNASLTQIHLPRLLRVDTRVVVTSNAGLRFFQLPNALTIGGSLQIQSNAALIAIDLPELLLVGNTQLQNNTSLTAFRAPNLTFGTGALELFNLPNLVEVDVSSLVGTAGALVLQTLPKLANLYGFAALAAVGGDLTVRSCGMLNDFTGMPLLVDVANMTVRDNMNLSSFTGLDAMSKVGGDLTITGNGSLSASTAQDFVSRITVVGSVTIN
jgi:hypothetical protein